LLACGAHLKNTFCLGKGKQAFLSQHIGDVENLETLLSFRESIQHFQRLFDISPAAVAYDLHPEYLATTYALASEIPCKIGIQHHHAHIASVMAEHGLTEAVIGIAADGTGYGTDGALWGGEIMIADLKDFQRLAYLDYMPLPGGEQAIRQPWRMAAAYLARTYGDTFLRLDLPFVRRLDRTAWRTLAHMSEKGINCPQTSSLGRLFDAVAALLGLHHEVDYEGQAAIALEMLAMKCNDDVAGYPFALRPDRATELEMTTPSLSSLPTIKAPFRFDVAPLIEAITQDCMRGVSAERIARSFHLTIARMLTSACIEARKQAGLCTIALSGGVFQNRLLLELLLASLEQRTFQIYINRRVPPNDGGLSLGQLAIAAARRRSAENSH
jgi:hydrogenase maturation protein HypF